MQSISRVLPDHGLAAKLLLFQRARVAASLHQQHLTTAQECAKNNVNTEDFHLLPRDAYEVGEDSDPSADLYAYSRLAWDQFDPCPYLGITDNDLLAKFL